MHHQVPRAGGGAASALWFQAGIWQVTKGRVMFQAEGIAYAKVWSPRRAFLAQGIVRGPVREDSRDHGVGGDETTQVGPRQIVEGLSALLSMWTHSVGYRALGSG